MQLSTGITWQFAVTLFPELSMAVQRVQTKAAMARLGVSNNSTLKSMAAELVSKSIFFFMLKFLPFYPDEWAVVDEFFHRGSSYGKCRQPLWVIVPVKGQMQESIGLTSQVAVTLLPLLSKPVQVVQLRLNALAGVISNAALRTMAPTLTSKSIFFFTLKFSLSAHLKMGLAQ